MCLPGTVEAVREQIRREGPPRFDRRTAVVGAVGAAVAAAFPTAAVAGRSAKKRKIRDLTHVFAAGFPVFAFDPPARETLVTVPTAGFYAQRWTFGEHSGTHMDAPGHFIEDGRRSPQITPEELVVPIVVVDVSKRAKDDPDAVVTPDDLLRFESKHGRIPDGAIVCMDSGWGKKIDDPLAYKGGAAFPDYHFPGFGVDAIDWLLANRNAGGIGVDTMSLDHGPSLTFTVHTMWLGSDRYGLENLNNLHKIPPTGATAYVGLIPWEEGSGGPCRVLAIW